MNDNNQIKSDKQSLPSSDGKSEDQIKSEAEEPADLSGAQASDSPISSDLSENEATVEPEVSETETELEQEAVVEPAEETVTEDAATTEVVEPTPGSSTEDLAKDEQVFEEKTEEADPSTQAAQDEAAEVAEVPEAEDPNDPDKKGRWYVVHTYSGHENRVATAIRQRIESEHLEHKIFDILVPTQDKIEIRGGKKEQVKEKIFPGYILVKMDLDDASWLAVRTTQGVTSFVGIGNKPTPISELEVRGIRKFMTQGATSTFKDIFAINDTVKIIDGPFSEFIGKVDAVDKEKGKVRVLVSIFGRETPVELDFLQVQKL